MSLVFGTPPYVPGRQKGREDRWYWRTNCFLQVVLPYYVTIIPCPNQYSHEIQYSCLADNDKYLL